MDVEAVRRFDDLLNVPYFLGVQKEWFINNAIMGSVPEHAFLDEQLAYIKACDPADPQFGNETGPRMVTKLLRERDPLYITVHPVDTFYPYHWNEKRTDAVFAERTVAVHHWGSSWDQH